jgi:hypothetical protein
MKTIAITSIAAAMLMAVSMPALAQMGSSSMSNGSGMSSDSSKPMTCQGMMDKANGMAQPTDDSKKAMAMKQMDMAKAAMAKGDEKTCMSHMKMAMHNMM